MVPLYQQLSEKIKQQIADGKLKAGDKLMTEAEFSQHFEVSRITVRKAIELLADDGFVVRKQGIGTFVAEKKLHRVVDNQIISFTEMSKMDGHVPSAELITVEWITPDGSIARKLRVDENEKVLRIVRLRKNDDVPVMIEDSYYPKRMEFLLKENLLGSTYEFFHNHGLIPTHSVKTVEICYATPEEAQRLGVPEKHALLLQKDEVFDQDDEVLHYSKLLTNPQRYRLTIVTEVHGSYHPASCVLAGVKLLKDKPGNVLKLPSSSQKMDVCQLRNCIGQRTSLLL